MIDIEPVSVDSEDRRRTVEAVQEHADLRLHSVPMIPRRGRRELLCENPPKLLPLCIMWKIEDRPSPIHPVGDVYHELREFRTKWTETNMSNKIA